MIRKQKDGTYKVYSHTGREFGTYKTKAEADKRIAQMEMFKNLKKHIKKKNN